ncbi:MAG: transposase [Hydrococcus sp. SU_1_0]|nr:transposase [Hydrococcus sp. SU_1_0]
MLIKNRHLSKALSDAALGTIRQQTEYKCEGYSSQLILADRFFPSSQLCSDCGHRQKMPLSVRVFDCEVCNNQKDRDLNASINLEHYIAYIAAGSVALRSVDGVLPTVPCEADGKHQQGVQCTVLS